MREKEEDNRKKKEKERSYKEEMTEEMYELTQSTIKTSDDGFRRGNRGRRGSLCKLIIQDRIVKREPLCKDLLRGRNEERKEGKMNV